MNKFNELWEGIVMQYMGSKKRIAKYILPIILKDRQEGQWYVEPFCGGCNTLSEVTGNRIGADFNSLLIMMWKAVSQGWLPPVMVTKQKYEQIRAVMDLNNPITPYALYVYSCRNIFNHTYISDKPYFHKLRNKWYRKNDNLGKSNMKQFPKLRDVIFNWSSYNELTIPENSIIYCDPPYANTFGYNNENFNSIYFWDWVRSKVKLGHRVFISEFDAPGDFICVWSRVMRKNYFSNEKQNIEKLFVHRSQV